MTEVLTTIVERVSRESILVFLLCLAVSALGWFSYSQVSAMQVLVVNNTQALEHNAAAIQQLNREQEKTLSSIERKIDVLIYRTGQ